ncbi:hypothetical protein ACWDTD_20280 [Gordonia sp. NPDC003425]
MVIVVVVVVTVFYIHRTKSAPEEEGPTIAGTVRDWLAAVCLPSTETDIGYRGMSVDLYQHATTAQRCFNGRREPIAVASYETQADLSLDLSCHYAGWWTTTKLEDGDYLLFRSNPTWTREQSSLLPLEQFGFTITLEQRKPDGTTPQWCYAQY